MLSLSLKLYRFKSFKPKRIFMNTFAEVQFEIVYVYEFQTKVNSYEGICWVPVWSYLSWRVSNKTEFLWTHLLSLSLELWKFLTFKQNRTLMKTFGESQFEVIYVYAFQIKANSYEDISWGSIWIPLNLRVSNKT